MIVDTLPLFSYFMHVYEEKIQVGNQNIIYIYI